MPPNQRLAAADVPSWLSGAWTRDWIQQQGARSSTLDVRYLQTAMLFGDVRIPKGRPRFQHAASFADLTDQELRLLAQQESFSVRAAMDGGIATWHHHVDFQPPDGTDDVGRLEPIAHSRMYEHALDVGTWSRGDHLRTEKGDF